MAQGFPSRTLDTVLAQLGSPVFQTIKLNYHLHSQLRDLRSNLELIRDVIHEAEWMAVLFNEIVGKWVCELQSLLYKVDDLLDEAITRSMPASDMVEKVRLCLCSMPFDLTLAHKMKKLNKRLDGIVEKCYECNLFVVVELDQQPSQPSNININKNRKSVAARKGILHYDPDCIKDDEFEMIGREDDKSKVIEMLCSEDPNSALVWVLGMAGVGKSTLCRAVFNDVEIMNRFEIRLWFSFSDGSCYPFVSMWKKIVTALGDDEEAYNSHDPEATVDHLWDKIASKINNKRTLLVFDNFPNGSLPGSHEPLKHFLGPRIVASHKGSKILLPVLGNRSTSSFDDSADSVYVLENDISEDHCWSIFTKAASVPGHADDGQMIYFRKQIVSKCLGNSALLKGVGTLLYRNNDNKAKWEYFVNDFDFTGRYDCYAYACFLKIHRGEYYENVAYLSLFSKGEFKRTSLYKQFAAHGFAKVPLENLRSWIAFSSEDDWHHEDYFKIRPELESWSLYAAGRESTTMQCIEVEPPNAARHVAIVRPSWVPQTHTIILPCSLATKDITHRRTLIFSCRLPPISMSLQTLDKLVRNLRYLRVLDHADLHDLRLMAVPSSIGELIHLRYLDLSRNDFKMLPKSIYKLKNLQTLMLIYCDKLIQLPQHIGTLRHLNSLEIHMCYDLSHMPSTIAELSCLETLDRFVVNPHTGGLKYLEYLDNLNGLLVIELPRKWKNSITEAEQARLERKKRLGALVLKWPGVDNGGDPDDVDDNDMVLEKLKPCPDMMKELRILNFGGRKFPSWMRSFAMEYSGLLVVVITRCKRCEILPLFGEMPNLQRLTLTSMNIEYVQDYNSRSDHVSGMMSSDASMFFPSLQELVIGDMPNLKGWSKAMGLVGSPKFSNLGGFDLRNCPHLAMSMMPTFSNIQDLTLHAVSNEILLQLAGGKESSVISIGSIPNMVSLPNQIVNELPKQLTITRCNQLQMLWETEFEGTKVRGSMDNLLRLKISDCHALKYLSSNLRQLRNLEEMFIYNCSEELDLLYGYEDGMPWEAIPRLSHLQIEGFQKLVALPKGIRRLPELTDLTISNCKNLKWEQGSLPPKLEDLYIISCPLFYDSIGEIQREHPNLVFYC